VISGGGRFRLGGAAPIERQENHARRKLLVEKLLEAPPVWVDEGMADADFM